MARQVKPAPQVALLVETSRSYGRGVLRGIAQYARTRSNWSLLHQEMTIDAFLPEWIQESRVSGIIARVNPRIRKRIRDLRIPCVDVQCSQKLDDIPQVETDDHQVSQLAFEHLWERGFRRFAFCGFQSAHFSENRLHAFRRLVEKAGCPLSVYTTPANHNAPVTTIEESALTDVEPLEAWLASLLPPTGLFVCNDIRGQQVLNAFNRLDHQVPDDIGVLGVDDDDTICPLCTPSLSSVRPNAERVGYRAAEVLDTLMRGVPHGESIEYLPPTGVVQRMSTQALAIADRQIARVCRFIREHACEGIGVEEVADFAGLSRRQLERRFRKELNRTPHAEITAVQIAKVKQLLLETDMTLEQIAPLAGYSYKESLSSIFKREIGKTPGEFRLQNASHSSLRK